MQMYNYIANGCNAVVRGLLLSSEMLREAKPKNNYCYSYVQYTSGSFQNEILIIGSQ